MAGAESPWCGDAGFVCCEGGVSARCALRGWRRDFIEYSGAVVGRAIGGEVDFIPREEDGEVR